MLQLRLLRRLSMRGNPLGSLTELQLTGGLEWPGGGKDAGQSEETNHNNNNAFSNAAGQLGEQAARALANMSRLLETYPQLFAANAAPTRYESAAQFASERFADEPQREALVWLLRRQEAEASHQLGDTYAPPPQQQQQQQQGAHSEPHLQLRQTGNRLAHFEHLQELDFGHCHLSYIQASVLAQLHSLKRLLLDGNQLR